MVVTLNSELLSLSPTDSLINDKITLSIKKNLTKEFQGEEEVLIEIAEMIGNVAGLNLWNNIDEDLIDAHKQITNLSNNTYLQQIHDDNINILDNNGNIIFNLLHQRWKYHKAYTSKKMI